jgi:hypothetical protein
MVSEIGQALAAGKVSEDNNLKHLPMRCYAFGEPPEGSLSQRGAKIIENRWVLRELFPR